MFLFLAITGGIVSLVLITLLSLLIISSVFGWLVFGLFWLIVIGLVVFFSLNLAWLILIIALIYGGLFLKKCYTYFQLPDYNHYIKSNINVFYNNALHCNRCGSDNLAHEGILGAKSKYRFYRCLVCKVLLYRFLVI